MVRCFNHISDNLTPGSEEVQAWCADFGILQKYVNSSLSRLRKHDCPNDIKDVKHIKNSLAHDVKIPTLVVVMSIKSTLIDKNKTKRNNNNNNQPTSQPASLHSPTVHKLESLRIY